jgi:N-methylhydantoinase A
MTRILVPETPGAQSALGLLMTDVRTDFMRTQITSFDAGNEEPINAVLRSLSGEADAWFEAEGSAPEDRQQVRRLDMRYRGQNFELPIDLEDSRELDSSDLSRVLEGFHRAHERVYGYSSPGEPVEIVTYRVQAVGRADRVDVNRMDPETGRTDEALRGQREIYLSERLGFVRCPVYDRALLRHGAERRPAVIEQMDTPPYCYPATVAEWTPTAT